MVWVHTCTHAVTCGLRNILHSSHFHSVCRGLDKRERETVKCVVRITQFHVMCQCPFPDFHTQKASNCVKVFDSLNGKINFCPSPNLHRYAYPRYIMICSGTVTTHHHTTSANGAVFTSGHMTRLVKRASLPHLQTGGCSAGAIRGRAINVCWLSYKLHLNYRWLLCDGSDYIPQGDTMGRIASHPFFLLWILRVVYCCCVQYTLH